MGVLDAAISESRLAEHAIEPLFLRRWSPRALDGAPLPEHALARILEAARWAPSASNIQPWRFVYALRGEPGWGTLLGLLRPNNQLWAKHSGALVFICSETVRPGRGDAPAQPSRSHSFDAGAAWAFLALQATALGWHTHAMGGFDHERAHAELNVPESFRIEVAVAIGRLGDKALLAEDLKARERPSDRRPLRDSIFRARFP